MRLINKNRARQRIDKNTHTHTAREQWGIESAVSLRQQRQKRQERFRFPLLIDKSGFFPLDGVLCAPSQKQYSQSVTALSVFALERHYLRYSSSYIYTRRVFK